MAFDAITGLLNAGGTNYTVFLRAFSSVSTPVESAAAVVRRAVGDRASIAEVRCVSEGDVVDEVSSSLSYVGDAGAGPDLARIQSAEFRKLLAAVIAQASALANSSTKIERFEFREGHPAYPVFWDFAFLFTGPRQSVVLVGSSSD